MFFLLSKLLYILLLPTVWLVVLAVAAVADPRTRWRRRWRWTLLVVLLLTTNLVVPNLLLRAWELPPVTLRHLRPHHAAVLLTGITTSHQPNDRVYVDRGADRLLHTLWLYRAGRVRQIIISGGSGSIERKAGARSEAQELAVLLRLAGVPRQDILLETRSRNTHENAQYTRQLLARHPEINSLVLVTSAFHQRRAVGCFQKAGLTVTPFPADYRSVQPTRWPDYWLVPTPEALTIWSLLLHEVSGYLMYKALGYC